PLSALDAPLRRSLRDELRTVLSGWGTAAVVVTHDFTEAYQLADRIVIYEGGQVIQSAPRAELLWQPASEAGARIMGVGNRVHGPVGKAMPARIQIAWRGLMLEAVNSPTRLYLPPADSPIAFFIRPEYVRLIRKDRGSPDAAHHMNLMRGRIVGESDFGTVWSLRLRLDGPGSPAQGSFDLEVEVPRLVYRNLEKYTALPVGGFFLLGPRSPPQDSFDLEVEVPRLVYEILEIERDRHWEFSIHRGSIHVLPT